MTDSDVARVHKRLDDLFEGVGDIKKEMQGIKARCEPCSKLVQQHQATLHGNGSTGLKTEIAKLKTGRVDTLTVKSVCALMGSLAALIATIIGAALIQ